MSSADIIHNLKKSISELPDKNLYGTVSKIQGLLVEISGVETDLSVGDRCRIISNQGGQSVMCEVIGFANQKALAMPFMSMDSIGLGCKAEILKSQLTISPDASWLGRVINAIGEPLDGKGPLVSGNKSIRLRSSPPPAATRKRLGPKLDLGVKAINSFLSTCQGQRMGIFSGSGVGKSVLMSMLARYTSADISVIGLIGERGREVKEFIEDDLGEEGLKRSVVIVSTSDESPLMRRQGAYMTMAVAEYFRDSGNQVLCMMDSITRFAMAQREIGLSIGEPPTSKGYPPTTFSELAKLLERAGPGIEGNAGDITGYFSVLVEGDDHNEPISDAVRGIIDGHVVLSRDIANRGRYPAIDILKSISRSMPRCLEPKQAELVKRGREIMSIYEDMQELIRIGAYRKGSDLKVDEAIELYPAIEQFLSQFPHEKCDLPQGYIQLEQALNRSAD